MSTFEDRIKDVRGKVQEKAKDKALETQPTGTSTESASKQLTTIATGKAAPTGPSGQSNVAEQMAQQSTMGQLDSVAQQANQQVDQMQLQAQQADVQQKSVESNRRSKELQVDTQRSIQTDNILSQFRQGNLDLESEEGQFQLQILGSQLSRNNKRYMQKVKDVAARRGINDKASFIREGTRLQLGNAKTEMYKQLGFLTAEGDKQRDFKEVMGKMGADDWFKIAEAAVQDNREATKISAATSIAKAGVDTWSASKAADKGES